MPQTPFKALFAGPPAYKPRTSWNPWAAAGVGLVLFAAALFAAYGATVVVKLVMGLGSSDAQASSTTGATMLVWLFAMQIILVILVVIASGWLDGNWRDVLALQAPASGLRVYVEALALMLLLVGTYNALLYLFAREALLGDLKIFVDIARSPARWLALASIGGGAPVSEELFFRGFLLSAFAASALGFWRGAALTTAAWTSLHMGYSVYGLVEVMLVGFYFCWLLWRTGSLRVPLVCHAIYNASLLLALMLLPIKL